MSKYNLQDIFEGMSDQEFADAKEKERLEKHPERDKIKAIQALLAKERDNKKTNEDLFDKAYVDAHGSSEDNVDNIDKVASPSAKGKGYDSSVAAQSKESGDEMKQITQTTKPMFENMIDKLAKKLKMSKDELIDKISKMQGKEKDEIEAAARAGSALAENRNTRLSNEVSNRIEGLLNIPMKKKFLDVGMDLIQDLLEEDPFEIDDVIQHLANELGDYYDNFLGAGERLANIPENGHVEDYADEIGENMYIDDDEFEMEMVMDRAKEIAPILKGIDMDIIVDFVKTHRQDIRGASDEEIKSEFEDFRSVNYDYINEDLKKQFKRFM